MVSGRKESAIAYALVIAMAAVVLIGALVVLGGDEEAASPEQPAGSGEEAEPRAPLTGVALEEGEELQHPAVAIKVSDVEQAHPQVGLDQADLVFAQPVGVNYTRLVGVFHSDLPDTVGPVRSVRPADAPLLGPLSPVFGNTMGAEWVLDYVYDAAELEDAGTLSLQGSDAYSFDDARPQPDHVFADPQELLNLSDLTEPPDPYLAYARDEEPSSAEQEGDSGAGVDLSYGPDWPVTWTFDDEDGEYLREQPWGAHTMADGTQISATNVLVLEVESTTDKIGDGAGQPVPVLHLVEDSGSFVALSDGTSVTGTWSKGEADEPFELRTDEGDELQLSPGNTWIELPEPSAEVTTR